MMTDLRIYSFLCIEIGVKVSLQSFKEYAEPLYQVSHQTAYILTIGYISVYFSFHGYKCLDYIFNSTAITSLVKAEQN